MKPVLASRHGDNVTSFCDDLYDGDGRPTFALAA
jgi:hypothetical protein